MWQKEVYSGKTWYLAFGRVHYFPVLRLGGTGMFRGVSGVNIDSKGRMVVPVRYRDALQKNHPSVVLTIDTEEKCLLLYPMATWEEIEKKLAELPAFNPGVRRIQRLLVGHATETEIDSHGRILLPPLLREYAGIERHVTLVGQGKKFELWDEAHWQARRQLWLAEESVTATLPEEVTKLSL